MLQIKQFIKKVISVLGSNIEIKKHDEEEAKKHSRVNNRHRRINRQVKLCKDLPISTKIYEYGIYQDSSIASAGTLWPTHDAGFFSCLTTIMWTIIELQNEGVVPSHINNKFSMSAFKELRGICTWHEIFKEPTVDSLRFFQHTAPIVPEVFNHHSNYRSIVHDHLGLEWIVAFLNAYMVPQEEIYSRARSFISESGFVGADSIAVCYRGTDKYKEITPAGLQSYFDEVDKQLKKRPHATVLIQTDQLQVRDIFLERYGKTCKYIQQMPFTTGDVVIHKDSSVCGDRDELAKNLYAMCVALAQCSVLVVHTGNVGFFLGMHMLVEKKEVIQLS